MWQAVASNAGSMGGFMDMAMIPWKIGAKNAEAAEATYAQSMQKWAQAEQAKEAMYSELITIKNIKSQKILSDIGVEQNQKEAQAAAEVAAAVAGVEGSAVDQVVQSTEVNEAMRKGDIEAQTAGAINQSLENIYGYGRDHSLATQEPFQSKAMEQMMNAVFGMAPGGYGLLTGQGPSGGFGLFGTSKSKRVDKEGSASNIFLS